MSKDFGEKLRLLRKRKELTQKQVADAVHMDRSTYAYYERGTTEPSLITTRKLAEVFGVSLDDLLPDTDRRNFAKVSDASVGAHFGKNTEEDFILGIYRTLTPEQKESFRDALKQIKDKE